MYSTVLLYCVIAGTDLQNQLPKSPAYNFKWYDYHGSLFI